VVSSKEYAISGILGKGRSGSLAVW